MMFKDMKRARRRHDLARMKAKVRRAWNQGPEADRFANHMAWCARGCCANPRRFWGELTMQEIRQNSRDRYGE